MRALRWVRAAAIGVAALFFAVGFGHFVIAWSCRIEPPAVPLKARERAAASLRRVGASFVVKRGGLLEVHLRGGPEEIGHAHASLLYPEMVENEGALLEQFRAAVPNALLRGALLDLAQLRYRNVDQGMSTAPRSQPERRHSRPTRTARPFPRISVSYT
jgi:hypothetical protein